ncbi:MAG: HupE/UreJ family protein, partial [Planctomycetota bacterium]
PTSPNDADDPRLDYLNQHREEILAYVRQHFDLHIGETELPIEYGNITILDLPGDEGRYAQFHYTTPAGEVPDEITIKNTLFVEDDSWHRSLVCIERNANSGQKFSNEFVAMVFGAHNPVQTLDLNNIELLLRPRDFVYQGMLHIWAGLDHILFLIALLLPAVLVLSSSLNSSPDSDAADADQNAASPSNDPASDTSTAEPSAPFAPAPNFRVAFWNILKIVSIFTIAHSITLSLASLGIVDLPGWIVESIIALSIIFVTVNTFLGSLSDRNWIVIFLFGLFHGLGFASVMSDLPFRMVHLFKVLIGFNVGVELGQIVIVALVFPILFFLRSNAYYQRVILKGGCVVIGLIACIWFVERAFGLGPFLPGV